MITFLRRMRHRLLRENRLTRYLVYALGEIVLVVVGILIALMINSAWQDRQDRIYEKEVLQQFRISLQEDMSSLDGISKRTDQRAAALRTLITAIHSGQTEMDSVLLKAYWDVIDLGVSFDYNTSIYESLKLRGVEKIRNDTLRLEILSLYENALPRQRRFINSYDDDLSIDQRAIDMQAVLFTAETVTVEDGSPSIQLIPVDGFLQKKELLVTLMLYDMEVKHFFTRKRQLLSHLRYRLRLINEELERL